MPCDTVQTATVDLGKVDRQLLERALFDLGIPATQYQYQASTGRLTLNGRAAAATDIAAIKQSYSKQVVLTQAQKFGWKVKQVGAFKWEVQR